MKQYPKSVENISKEPSELIRSNIGSSLGTAEELATMFRSFYKEAHLALFDLMVKQVWLEQKFLYGGVRGNGRSANGFRHDSSFSYFMKYMVGISQKPLTQGFFFVAVPTYFADFFPEFSEHNPFEEPEYFKYPYKHVTLDHLLFVYQCHNRLELLEEAERKKMKIGEFHEWSHNWIASYSYERPNVKDKRGISHQLYEIKRFAFTPYIKSYVKFQK